MRIITSLLINCLLASCTAMQEGMSDQPDKIQLTGYNVVNTTSLGEVLNYFVFKNENSFEKVFDDGVSTEEPDFGDNFVVAIVGKPTTKEYDINIVKTEVKEGVLHVHYDVNYSWRDLLTPVTPSAILAFDKDLDIYQVQFHSQGTLRHWSNY